MVSDIWLRTILIVRKETRCRHIGYSYRLTARVLLYAQSHRQDNTYHGLCYTSRGALAGTRNSSMDAANTSPKLFESVRHSPPLHTTEQTLMQTFSALCVVYNLTVMHFLKLFSSFLNRKEGNVLFNGILNTI